MHGMLEMFTYLNLPILFGIILLCRIFKVGGYMYLVVHCSKKNEVFSHRLCKKNTIILLILIFLRCQKVDDKDNEQSVISVI